MSSPDSRTDSILRQPVIGSQVRRLPGLRTQLAHRSSSEETECNASNARAVLLEQFATELAVLKEEARQQEVVLRKGIEQERSQLMALVTAIRAQHEQLIPELEPVVARLALMVVAKMLEQHQVDRPLVADLAKHAIEVYRLGTRVQIIVATEDHACIQAHESSRELRQYLQIDHELTPGSCLIDYGSGQLDVSLATQWAAIKAVVLQAASGASRVVST